MTDQAAGAAGHSPWLPLPGDLERLADLRAAPFDWCDALADRYAGYLEEAPDPSDGGPPIPYSRNWPNADAWIDPHAKTIYLRP